MINPIAKSFTIQALNIFKAKTYLSNKTYFWFQKKETTGITDIFKTCMPIDCSFCSFFKHLSK